MPLPSSLSYLPKHGSSELKRFWIGEVKREFAQFASRVNFDWMDDLSLVQIQERIAKLPPRSAVMYGFPIVDAAGVPHERQDALARLYAVANAPIVCGQLRGTGDRLLVADC